MAKWKSKITTKLWSQVVKEGSVRTLLERERNPRMEGVDERENLSKFTGSEGGQAPTNVRVQQGRLC